MANAAPTGTLGSLRRSAAPLSALTLLSFFTTTFAPAVARASDGAAPPSAPSVFVPASDVSVQAAPLAPTNVPVAEPSGAPDRAGASRPLDNGSRPTEVSADALPSAGDGADPDDATDPDDTTDPDDSTGPPVGGEKSGVTSKTISVPTGSGSIQGMGESFSAQLSTGIATFSVPFSLPAARGGAQPSLGLSYSSGGGLSVAGQGWSIGSPFIARESDRGLPTYDDRETWHPNQDRFVFNGGQELVPICVVGDAAHGCDGKLVIDPGTGMTEELPVWAAGHQYFRARVEGSFLRFFWAPDHLTWRVQDKSGTTMELGVPLDGSNDTTALERNPEKPSEVYRWHLVRQYDTYGNANPALGNPTPVNVVVYRYFQDAGSAYLSDIFDTTPASTPTGLDLNGYAHHTRLVYQERTDPTFSFRTGWRMDQRLRLVRVDVASKTFNGAGSDPRHLVRRYHLAYDPGSHVSLLSSVQVEGRCADDEGEAPPEGGDGKLPEQTNCERLPPMVFGYSHVQPFTTSGQAGTADLPGYDGFDERVTDIKSSPPHSVDEELTELFDLNSDGLPDILNTQVGIYGNGHGVFLNGKGGAEAAFGDAELVRVNGVLGATATDITLKNLNLNPLDLNGDATIDLLHMPRLKTYSIYTPERTAQGWVWQGRVVETADQQDPKIDFGKDTLDKQVVDVNFDGLVDVVASTGTEYQTFFALGRLPNGDGQFGQGSLTGPETAELSTEPVRTCVPHSGLPIRLSDKETKLADMNGDGIVDIVKLQRGAIRYWPGRGNGFWGTGKRDDCPANGFGFERHLSMEKSPLYSDIEQDGIRLDDVNGDGLSDIVQIRYSDVDVWLNVDGVSWTERHIIKSTPLAPSYAPRVRLVDINGSGTPDILWADGGRYKYIDLHGGKRPLLLSRVENGLGKSTTLEYGTSTTEMLTADAYGGACDPLRRPWSSPWCQKMPTVTHVVKRVTESNNLTIAGKPPSQNVTEYSYRDPVFEGRQREFRGFQKAKATRLGDSNSPADVAESTFLLGECEDEDPDDGLDPCSTEERWRDSPREALKGLPILSEKYDLEGNYLSTEHTEYHLRVLYVGLDGREVRHAFEAGKRSILYDTGPFVPALSVRTAVPSVTLEREPGVLEAARSTDLPVRSATNIAEITSSSDVDFFGNATLTVANGCVAGAACPTADVGVTPDEVITTVTVPGRPAGDPTGWLWRTVQTYVTGSAHTGPGGAPIKRSQNYTQYNAQGAPILVEQELSGTLPLERFHESGGTPGVTFAAAPPNASTDGRKFASATTYDGLGNVARQTAANGRCSDLVYDSNFSHLPTLETIYTQGCGTGPLVTVAQAYDRGLALITVVLDLQGQPTKLQYDPFGRVIEFWKPHPTAAGMLSALPSVKFAYFLPTDLGTGGNPTHHSIIHTQTQDSADHNIAGYLESWAYVDGLGRTITTLNEADITAQDTAPYIAADLSDYDDKGAVRRKHIAFFFNGDPLAFPFGAIPDAPYGRQRYDAFGRQLQTYDLDGTVTLQSRYHALSTDLWDAADLEPGPHHGSYASTRNDGHGRAIASVERFHQAGVIEKREVRTRYLPTKEPEVITRVRVGASDPAVVRWLRYDSLGRRLLNVEPNTTVNFNPDHATDPTPGAGKLKAWRYAYNDAGDLVGTSDARGCGVNFHYDSAGRLLAEDYSPCMAHHAAYTAPNLAIAAKTGIEVLYQFGDRPDLQPSGLTAPSCVNPSSPFGKARLVAVHDRASTTWNQFDGRGRIICTGTRVAQPTEVDAFATRYAARWYIQETRFDAADREVLGTTGAVATENQGTAVPGTTFTSAVTTTYGRRGTVTAAGGSYGALVDRIKRRADGLIEELSYADLADTTTALSYDNRRRLSSVQTYRGTPASWSSPPASYQPPPTPTGAPSNFQLLLQDRDFIYDSVANPLEIRDWRNPDEWPSDAKPVTRKMQYDDLNRLTRIDYQHHGGDTWTSPFAAENGVDTHQQDPRRAKPSPHISFAKRVRNQTYRYDWLGNTSTTGDDSNGFYDRSLGAVTNATTGGNAAKPYQLKSATGTGASNFLSTQYDPAGNLLRLNVSRSGTCLPSGALCLQRFDYQWDEVGRLVRARRWDVSTIGQASDPLPGTAPAVDLKYRYDASDERVIKSATSGAATVHTLYIFDSLELRRALYSTDYDQTGWTEVPYLFAHGVRLGHVVWHDAAAGQAEMPAMSTSLQHVLLEIGDQLGSAGLVIDKTTGELVEASSYQAYGGADSDYRTARWKSFREDYRFTGKEEDVEVGLQYFGKRYLNPLLGRWISADPLGVDQPGEADWNLYAYVRGAVLASIDPLGLKDIMIVVSNAPKGSVDALAKEYAGQWKQRSLKTAVLNAKSGKLETTYQSAQRGVVTIPRNATPAQVAAAWKKASGMAGKGGSIIANYGHGAAGDRTGTVDSTLDLTPVKEQGRIRSSMFVDDKGVTKKSEPPAETQAKLGLLTEMGSAMREKGVASVQFLACRVGRDTEFAQHITNRLGVKAGFQRDLFGHGGDEGGPITAGNYVRTKSGRDVPIEGSIGLELPKPGVVLKPQGEASVKPASTATPKK